MNLQNPDAFIIYFFVVIGMIFIMRMNFIRFKDKKEKENYLQSKKRIRAMIIITRALIFLLLFIAIATPYEQETVTVEGEPSVTILADNSSSFSIFESGIAEELQSKLEDKITVTTKTIAYGERSAIGDGILNSMQGDDQLLIVSDGYNNYGRSMGDMITFASALNTTVNILDIKPVKKDAGVVIEGPSEVIQDSENEFGVYVNNIWELKFKLSILIDNEVYGTWDNTKSQIINKKFKLGYHTITAKLYVEGEDYFEQNNEFYKSVKSIPRPKLLYVSEKSSPLKDALSRVYDVTYESSVPDGLGGYHAVIIDDMDANELKQYVEKLSEYVSDGNGLIVVGGENSYNRGFYKDSLFETILPVKVGVAKRQPGEELNIILVIDISESSGLEFGAAGSSSRIDVEKALAIKILNDISIENNVGVIAFNQVSHLIAPLNRKSLSMNLTGKVASLIANGGTNVNAGLSRAGFMLEGAKGSRNIIVVSDGHTQYPEDALSTARVLSKDGIKIFSVGIGRETNRDFMRKLADDGNGIYFEPAESDYLKILFGDAPPQEKVTEGPISLILVDRNHFVTSGIELKEAEISGFNFVVPKPTARNLVSTTEGNAILTVWRFGLGRVVSLSTDDGNKWAGKLLSKDNSLLITRAINWAIGNPKRKESYDVSIKDATLGKTTVINVVADKMPSFEDLKFSKVGVNNYQAVYMPDKIGYKNILGAMAATSYNDEYKYLGINPELRDIVTVTGGAVFNPDDIDNMIKILREQSKRTKIKIKTYRWPFILAALIIFLAEIGIRRLKENRNLFK